MIKILILASNPRNDLDLDEEIRDLKDVIHASRNRQEFEVEDALAVRAGDLQELLFKHEPQIVHFCGHGSGESGLIFEGKDGREQWVQTEALRNLFRLFSNKVGCVLLNACYSEEQAEEIVHHIDYVIGMNQAIRDDAAIAFAKGFYRALGYNCSIEEAYEFGCNAIQLEISNGSGCLEERSAAERKLNSTNNVPSVVIPESQKPILKKHPNAIGNLWCKSTSPPLPSAQRIQLEQEVVQAVTGFPRLVSPEPSQPLVNPPSVPPPPITPTPQSLTETPQAINNRRLIATLVGSAVAILIPAIGLLGYSQWQKWHIASIPLQPSIPSSNNPADPTNPENNSSPNPSSQTTLPKTDPNDTTLQQVGDLVLQEQWKAAILILKKIPTNSDIAQKSAFQAYLKIASDQLLNAAEKLYANGDQDNSIDIALSDAQIIPPNSPIYPQAQTAIATWNREKQNYAALMQGLDEKWDLIGAQRLLKKINNPGLRQQAEAHISKIDERNQQKIFENLNQSLVKKDISMAKQWLEKITKPDLKAQAEELIQQAEVRIQMESTKSSEYPSKPTQPSPQMPPTKPDQKVKK
jgi:hypothetical protein